MTATSKVSEWKEAETGVFRRPLVGAERMFDDFHTADGWVEWIASVSFAKGDNTSVKQQELESWVGNAVDAVLLESPSLLAEVERKENATTEPPSTQCEFVYRKLADLEDFSQKRSQILSFVHSSETTEVGLKTVTDDFYQKTEECISTTLGPALVHFTFVSSDREPDQYAIALRSSHALNDFWSGMAILRAILQQLATQAKPDAGLIASQTERLHPCYIDLLRNPVDHHAASEEELAQGSQSIGKVRE